MLTRKAAAQWKGSIADGAGTVSVAGQTLDYSVPSRFQDGAGTNPEELIAAAHAGCFAMALSAGLTKAGHDVEQLDASAAVSIDKEGEGWSVKRIDLTVRGKVAGLDNDAFVSFAKTAKETCPISRALAGVGEITLDASLA